VGTSLKVISGKAESVSIAEAFHELWDRRSLLLAWTEREIKIRYKQAALG
jgi:ABC-type polysaccharide/polyol phosphate export permease